MTVLVIAVTVFAVLHALPAWPPVKQWARDVFGKAWGPIYGVLSLVSLVAAVWALRAMSDRPDLWVPASWSRHANFGITLVAFIFVGIFLFRGSWRNRLRYPMAIAVLVWGTGHLIANGDLGSVIFFGGMMATAMAQAVLMALGGTFVPSDERGGHNLLSVIAGIALFAVFAQAHGLIAGVPLVELSK